MFDYIPEKFANETADTEEEAARWLEGDKVLEDHLSYLQEML